MIPDKESFVAGYRAAYAKNGQDQTDARVTYIGMLAEDEYEIRYASEPQHPRAGGEVETPAFMQRLIDAPHVEPNKDWDGDEGREGRRGGFSPRGSE